MSSSLSACHWTGSITAMDRSAEEPTGIGGERLTEWAFGGDEVNRRYLENSETDITGGFDDYCRFRFDERNHITDR